MKYLDPYVDGYIKGRLYWFRAMSHLAIPLSLYGFVVSTSTWFKVMGIPQIYVVYMALGAIPFILLFGVFIVEKARWVDRENTVNNKYNPEIQEILKNGKQSIQNSRNKKSDEN